MRLRAQRLLGAASVLALASVGLGLAGAHDSARAATTTAAAVTNQVNMPTGNIASNGVTWKPVVSQDFTKNAARGQFSKVYGTAWAGYSGFKDTSNRGVYAPDKVLSVSGGNLNYYLHSTNGVAQVAAPMPNGYSPQTYGRYAIRVRTDSLPGYKLAFLLWPTSNNWNDGEIDFPDGDMTSKMYPASAIIGTYDKNGKTVPTFDKPPQSAAPTMGTGWHDAVIEWTKGHVRWYWDGKLVGQTTNTAGVPTKPMRWTLQAETAVDGTKLSSSTTGKVQVAWVVQYKES
ncbi:glycoside hydrolase family 16 protein [Frondihabitans australicus]|uniref:glycoside hydrolase family 16 protein n=1 Tax=Frondihabitans australicus TaxID=386892 RepID=UPI0011C392B7|nr:glycoside hydrolase family 16 protein [Frondihabitans australicus]